MQDDPATTEQPHAVRIDDPGAPARPDRGTPLALLSTMASPNHRICPFLRSIDDGDRLGIPFETPGPGEPLRSTQ